MPDYSVNRAAITHARKLIRAGKVSLRSEWGSSQPSADQENAYLASHTWGEYGAWHLGLVDGAATRPLRYLDRQAGSQARD